MARSLTCSRRSAATSSPVNGRELGHHGLAEFYELKAVQQAPAGA